MLSRTAEHLYWMTRYMERAETTARLLEVGARNALIPDVNGGFRNDWAAVLKALAANETFEQKYGDIVQRNIETFLFFDSDNPSSVLSCISQARENARVVRTAITAPVWDALNSAYQEMKQLQRTERSTLQLSELTEWTLRHAALLRGTIDDTQLRNDGYHFMGLGYAVERGDTTARLLDVKYYVLLPNLSYVGSGLDQTQWATLLRSLSAHRAFNWTYSGDLTAAKIADFLILNPQFPRSLRFAAEAAAQHLDALARRYGHSSLAQQKSRALLSELTEARVSDIFDEGLHEFLQRFMRANSDMASSIETSYLRGGLA